MSESRTVNAHDSNSHPEIDDRPPAKRRGEEPPEYGEFIVVDDGTHLSADQRRIAHELHRLFTSLCGGVPGQYWPQALLDNAGNFNRPVFPQRERERK